MLHECTAPAPDAGTAGSSSTHRCRSPSNTARRTPPLGSPPPPRKLVREHARTDTSRCGKPLGPAGTADAGQNTTTWNSSCGRPFKMPANDFRNSASWPRVTRIRHPGGAVNPGRDLQRVHRMAPTRAGSEALPGSPQRGPRPKYRSNTAANWRFSARFSPPWCGRLNGGMQPQADDRPNPIADRRAELVQRRSSRCSAIVDLARLSKDDGHRSSRRKRHQVFLGPQPNGVPEAGGGYFDLVLIGPGHAQVVVGLGKVRLESMAV